jgi:L-ascorbate 6-phosphate lactonase
MLNLKDISTCIPKQGSVLAYWLGGSGFVFKLDDGMTICIDPYLSDSVERLFGFKRLMAAPIAPDKLKFDLLLITHEHGDHLDIDIFETLVKNNPSSKVIATKSCESFISEHTQNYIVTTLGNKHHIGDIIIESVKADHGELSPDAVGFMIHFNNRKIYFTGDTALDYAMMDYVIKLQPDIVIPCINGAYGNMNESESAELVAKCHAEYAIGSHYGLFNEHGGDVDLFKANLAKINSAIKCLKLNPGQGEEI